MLKRSALAFLFFVIEVQKMIVSKVKRDLRINHNLIDGEISDVVNSCVLDLAQAGISIDINSLSAIEETAIKLYCKAWYDFGGKGEQYKKNYESLKIALSICQGENQNV